MTVDAGYVKAIFTRGKGIAGRIARMLMPFSMTLLAFLRGHFLFKVKCIISFSQVAELTVVKKELGVVRTV